MIVVFFGVFLVGGSSSQVVLMDMFVGLLIVIGICIVLVIVVWNVLIVFFLLFVIGWCMNLVVGLMEVYFFVSVIVVLIVVIVFLKLFGVSMMWVMV